MKIYLAVLVGTLINLMFGLNEAMAKPDYRFLLFVKQNWFPTFANLVCGGSFVYFGDVTGWEALFFGSAGQYYWKKLSNIFNERVPTKFGINE